MSFLKIPPSILMADRNGQPSLSRRLMLVIPASIICYLADIRLTRLEGTGISLIPGLILSALLVLLLIRAFQLTAGIKFLAASIGLVISLAFVFAYYQLHQHVLLALSSCLACSLAALIFLDRSETGFLSGDMGSLVLGFLVAGLTIRFIELNNFNILTNLHPRFRSAPALIFGLLIVPFFDTFRVCLLRIARGNPLMYADRRHIYHRLTDFKLTPVQISFILSLVTLLFTLTAYFLQETGTAEILLFEFILALTLDIFFWNFARLQADKREREKIPT